ncbi:MAG: Y-family DNA polymerase [Candidatus Amulumruptor caecigallinarius]|nr:Y-family DNA polymerase [Candidatus Amulumruptor caecigallinarius]
MTGLADCNNFFVSCERTLNPALEGRAVVVLSNNDGCAVARSNEAKRMGVKMGQPAFQLQDLVRSGKLIALSGNHLLYRDISIRIHDIFRRFAPRTIDYSVDEAFLDMDGIPESQLALIGNAICDACWQEEHIPVTIGFAPTKTLAKIATEVGKKSGSRVIVLTDRDEIGRILKRIAINDMWGIGRRLTKKMYMAGVYTVADFAARDVGWVRSQLGVNGERSWMELHGVPCIELEHVDRERQDSISETRTFPEDVNDFDYLRTRIAIYCSHVSKRLRSMQCMCGAMSVFLRTNRFHQERGYYAPEASARFGEPTDDATQISTTGEELLKRIFRPDISYKRAGVVLYEIVPARVRVPSLFEDVEADNKVKRKSAELMKVIDSLNAGVGPHKLRLAAEVLNGGVGQNCGYSSSFGAPSKK